MIREINPFHIQNKIQADNYPIFYFDAFKEFIKKTSGHDIILLQHEDLHAIAVFKIRKTKFWRFAQLVHAPLVNGISLTEAKEKIFFDDAISYLKHKLKIDKIEQGDVLGFTKYKPPKSDYCLYGTYQIDLQNQKEENILNTFNSKFARDVRHAEKLNLSFKTGIEYIDDFYQVYKQTSEHKSMYTDSIEYFKLAVSIFAEHQCSFALAYDGHQAIGSIFMLKTPYKICITHTGTNRESNIHGAIRWLHYKNIIKSINDDIKFYDFMGVRIESKKKNLKGVFDFKKGFGGALEAGFLWKQTLRPVHVLPYSILLNLKNLSASNQYKDIIDQEK